MKDLPEFKRFNRDYVVSFVSQALTLPNHPEKSHFRRLVEYEDGHYGVIFALDYFASDDTPTKSQWNSLKKKLKRHDKRVFIFKDHSLTNCDEGDGLVACGCLEFGFFAHEMRPSGGGIIGTSR